MAELILPVENGTITLDFDGADLPTLQESSAYELVLMPAGFGSASSTPPTLWEGSYEAEDAEYRGSGYSRNGPEGSPSDVGKFYTSGGYNVGGLRTGLNVDPTASRNLSKATRGDSAAALDRTGGRFSRHPDAALDTNLAKLFEPELHNR